MENATKFDLEKNIAQWKQMLSQKGMNHENMLELESHLLDEIDLLKTKDLNVEEAFFIARKRIGTVDTLTEEYKKIDDAVIPLASLMTALKGILLYFVFIYGVENLSNLSALLGSYTNIQETTLITANIVMLIVIGASALSFTYLYTQNVNWNFRIFRSIPVLILSVILLKTIHILSTPWIADEIGIIYYGNIRVNFAFFQIAIVGVTLAISFVLSLKNKEFRNSIMISK